MNVVVTGGSSGIGKEIVRWFKLAEEKHQVIDLSRTTAGFDLSNPEYRDEALDFVIDELDSVDVLVNNAGVMLFEDSDVEFMEEMVQLNLITPWFFMKTFEDCKLFSDNANVINIGSISGMRPTDLPLYGATKAGIISLTESFAKMLAPKVRVNCISPGFFDTNLVSGPTPSELIEGVPMKREAEPKEIIPVLKMILESTYMTGSNVVIDGGCYLC